MGTKCSNPSSRYCACYACAQDKEALSRARNRAVYVGVNTIVEWTLSPRWEEIPVFLHVRGDATVRFLKIIHKAQFLTKIKKIVANGTVSGEIAWR